jgi:hypothetical protein
MVAVDARRMLRLGWSAPRWAERVWVDPMACRAVAIDLDHARRHSGEVIGGEWNLQPIESVAPLQMAEEHWRTGRSWEDVGAYDYVLHHVEALGRRNGSATSDEVVRRFARLDDVFARVQREGRLRSRRELPGWSIREHRGVYMHIGPDLAPVFGNGGCHRLAIARVLELPQIPVQLGAVHPDALGGWRALRSPAHG